LDAALKSYPYVKLVERWESRAKISHDYLLETYGLLAMIFFFGMIWFFRFFIEYLFCLIPYFIIDCCTPSPTAEKLEEWFDSNISSNIKEFDTLNVDNFVVERLQEICYKLNNKFARYGIHLKHVSYVDTFEVASEDRIEARDENSHHSVHYSRYTEYYDEFLIMNDDNNVNAV
jgi:hypothetical protein